MTYQPSVLSSDRPSVVRGSHRTFSSGEPSTAGSSEQEPFSDGRSYLPGVTEEEDTDPWAPRVYIAVDYGTTYTGVGWAMTSGEKPDLNDIRHIFSWPGIRAEAKTPSKVTYSQIDGTDQWGGGIGSGALVIRWTKLEIEPPTREKALDTLRETISETCRMKMDHRRRVFEEIPPHLIHSSEDVMTKYLTGVLTCARRGIEAAENGRIALETNQIDLVITHPAVWDPRAKNITFRAVMAAFRSAFSDIDYRLGNLRLASESEACAQYLMKEARERKTVRLRQGECFIVVDAGGGTVDLAAYQVMEVAPSFRVRRVTDTIGARCGATEIDRCFLKEYLGAKLSPADFLKLRDGEGSNHSQGSHVIFTKKEEEILENFMIIKHEFAGLSNSDNPRDCVQLMPLPEEIGHRNIPGVIEDGHLIIYDQEVKAIFDPTINAVTNLIGEQLNLLMTERFQTGTILLSGGFSRNEYLFSKIRALAARHTFKVVRSDDKDSSWTAVAKGAVLMGMGVDCDQPPPVFACPINIGVILSARFKPHEHSGDQKYTDSFDKSTRARNHTHWLVKKGDLVTNEGLHASVKLRRKYNTGGKRTGAVEIVISHEDDVLRPLGSSGPFVNSVPKIELEYDLSAVPKHVAANVIKKVSDKGKTFHQAEMTLDIWVSEAGCDSELTCGKTMDILGGTGAAGFRLDSKPLFSFPISDRRPDMESSFTAWGSSSAA